MKTAIIIGVVGAVAIGAYFVINSTTAQTGSACSGDWTDYVNPACALENVASRATSEINTILLILAVVVVAVVGLLAFGPSTGHLAGLGKAALV
jgi:ABC-type phosphate/phosphonate transport system permease subunit